MKIFFSFKPILTSTPPRPPLPAPSVPAPLPPFEPHDFKANLDWRYTWRPMQPSPQDSSTSFHQSSPLSVCLHPESSSIYQVKSENTADQVRRTRISQGLRALKETLPDADKATQESTLDDIIDSVKFLKFQIKALSQARLGGESETDPLLYIEGFGHYLPHQQVVSDPLEEVMEHLMDVSMPSAVQFLESKGLALLPMVPADSILQGS